MKRILFYDYPPNIFQAYPTHSRTDLKSERAPFRGTLSVHKCMLFSYNTDNIILSIILSCFIGRLLRLPVCRSSS